MIFNFLSNNSSFLSPEFLHKIFINSLKLNFFKNIKRFGNLEFNLLKKNFYNPLGLAAGFDKNAEAIEGEFNLGFGFVELGTVTPMPQKGNPKPRVFKIPEYEAVIQRLGFNNDGLERFLDNIKKYRINNKNNIIGANIGKNKNTSNINNDYKILFESISPFVDYITINISSPNTEGLRDLQKKGNIENLLETITKCNKKNLPTFIKISPDIDDNNLKNICKICIKEDSISGLVISNTTISRESLHSKQIRNSWKILEKGGLSGPPIKNLSNIIIEKVFKLTQGKILIIGVGGISTGKDAYEKISLGCNLVQIYTSLIYRGPAVVSNILSELSLLIKKDGYSNITQLVGKKVKNV
mgnify:FL=1